MTLKEAIEILQYHYERNAEVVGSDWVNALKLGIKALNCVKHISSMSPKSMLADCAYQGIPPKKWVKETAPYYDGYNKALEQIKAIIDQALPGETEE